MCAYLESAEGVEVRCEEEGVEQLVRFDFMTLYPYYHVVYYILCTVRCEANFVVVDMRNVLDSMFGNVKRVTLSQQVVVEFHE